MRIQIRKDGRRVLDVLDVTPAMLMHYDGVALAEGRYICRIRFDMRDVFEIDLAFGGKELIVAQTFSVVYDKDGDECASL